MPHDRVLTEPVGAFSQIEGRSSMSSDVQRATTELASLWDMSESEPDLVLHTNLRILIASNGAKMPLLSIREKKSQPLIGWLFFHYLWHKVFTNLAQISLSMSLNYKLSGDTESENSGAGCNHVFQILRHTGASSLTWKVKNHIARDTILENFCGKYDRWCAEQLPCQNFWHSQSASIGSIETPAAAHVFKHDWPVAIAKHRMCS